VKLKMAENSLFAILLRSRWWISFLICAAVALVSLAVFPKDISPFAALGAFPFFIVGCMALYRQMRAPSPARLAQIQETLRQQSWGDFCARLEAAWQAGGYTVQRLNMAGADLLLARDGRTLMVNARRWKAAAHGVEPLRELVDAARRQQAGGSIYVALQPLGENAAAWAAGHGVTVLDGTALATLIAGKKG
jgi:restriction system protein